MLKRSSRCILYRLPQGTRHFSIDAPSLGPQRFKKSNHKAWYDEDNIDPEHLLAYSFPSRFDYADAIETFEEWTKSLYFKPRSLRQDVAKHITATQKAYVPFYQFDITCHTTWTGNAEFVHHDTTKAASNFSHSSPFRYPAHFDYMCFIANETTLLPEEVSHLVFPTGDTVLERTHLDPSAVLEVEVPHEDAIDRIETRMRHEEKLRIDVSLKMNGARKISNLQISTDLDYNEVKLIYFPIFLLYYTINGGNFRAVISAFNGSINAERHYSRPKLFTVGALTGAATYSLMAPVGDVDTAYQAASAIGSGAAAILLPLYRKSWKRSIVDGESLNTKARNENDRKLEAKQVNDLLDENDEWFKRFAKRGKFKDEESRREKYQAYGEEHEGLYSQRHHRKRLVHTELYVRMGLTPEATDKEIRDAFQALAKKHHPDVLKEEDEDEDLEGEAKLEKFQKILEAFTCLKDAARRKKYDETGKTE